MTSASGSELPPPAAEADRKGDYRGSSVLSQAYSQAADAGDQPDEGNASEDGGDEESGEEDEDRENRFQGSESTWRHITQDERDLAASLDQQRANDLSIHLYNAHALKASLYHFNGDRQPWHGKRWWIKAEEDGSLPWHPDRHWTAWPLPPDEVPRPEESFVSSSLAINEPNTTYCKTEQWKPSGDLEEDVEALVLRKANERFSRRRWAGMDVGDRTRMSIIAHGERPSIKDESSHGMQHEGLGVPEHHTSNGEQYLPPVFLSDESEAHAILQPAVRHIVTEFDKVLSGLHQSRLGHERSRPSAPHSQSSRPRSRQRRRPESDNSEHERVESDRGSNAEDGTDHRTPSRQSRSRSKSASTRRPPGLRDWSEVLGIAALVGWDPAIIDRAAQRCACLLGEGMEFRTMPAGSAEATTERVARYLPDMIPELDSELDDTEVPDAKNGPQPLCCPYTDCPRHEAPYEQARRWREHLKKRHKLDTEQVKELETSLTPATGESSPSSRSPVPLSEGDGVHHREAESHDDPSEDMLGGVHVDGFLRLIPANLRRGQDMKERQRKGDSVRKTSKRRKLDKEAGQQTESGE